MTAIDPNSSSIDDNLGYAKQWLLADRKGQDPNLTSQGVSIHLRSR